MNNLENLKKELDVIELEERLEMVQLAAAAAEAADNSCCGTIII
jgi:hypothetical protein